MEGHNCAMPAGNVVIEILWPVLSRAVIFAVGLVVLPDSVVI